VRIARSWIGSFHLDKEYARFHANLFKGVINVRTWRQYYPIQLRNHYQYSEGCSRKTWEPLNNRRYRGGSPGIF